MIGSSFSPVLSMCNVLWLKMREENIKVNQGNWDLTAKFISCSEWAPNQPRRAGIEFCSKFVRRRFLRRIGRIQFLGRFWNCVFSAIEIRMGERKRDRFRNKLRLWEIKEIGMSGLWMMRDTTKWVGWEIESRSRTLPTKIPSTPRMFPTWKIAASQVTQTQYHQHSSDTERERSKESSRLSLHCQWAWVSLSWSSSHSSLATCLLFDFYNHFSGWKRHSRLQQCNLMIMTHNEPSLRNSRNYLHDEPWGWDPRWN